MIGGEDRYIEVSDPIDYQWRRNILRTIFSTWPKSYFESVDDISPKPLPEVDTEELRGEFFIYKNKESYKSWENYGAIPENSGMMIYFIIDNHSVTWVMEIDENIKDKDLKNELSIMDNSLRLSLLEKRI